MESTYGDTFKNDVKSLKRDNLHLKLLVQQKMKQINVFKQENLKLKLRVQQEEHDMNTVKQMLKRIIIDDKKIRDEKIQNEKALVIQRVFREKMSVKRVFRFRVLYLCFKSFEMNYLHTTKKREIDIKLLSSQKNIWYMNGNAEDIKIWDIFVKNGILLTWNQDGKNEGIKTKIKKGDIIAWYVVSKGFNSIVRVLESPKIMKPNELTQYYPAWKNKFKTLDNWIKDGKDNKYERISINVEFLATTNKHFVKKDCINGWKDDWTMGLRGSYCMTPTNSHWKEQVIAMYTYLAKK